MPSPRSLAPVPMRAALLALLVTVLLLPPAWAGLGPAKLAPEGVAAGDALGREVAADGDAVLVGAPGADPRGSSSGAAYVFRWDGAAWLEEAVLVPSDGAANDLFGASLALRGDVALVGAGLHDGPAGSDAGAVYVFAHGPEGWAEEAKLLPTDATAGQHFGSSVALDGDRALIGARGDASQGALAGAGYVFVRGAGGWTQEAKLLASDAQANDFLGQSVAALDGDLAVLAAPGDDDGGAGAGAAYLFRRGADGWAQEAKLLAADAAAGATFGIAVAASGGLVVVGAEDEDGAGDRAGAAYVFAEGAGGWAQEAKLAPPGLAAEDFLGHALDLRGDALVVAAVGDDDAANRAGALHAFRRGAAGWVHEAVFTAAEAAALDFLGDDVAIGRDFVAGGAPGVDDPGSFAGAAYVFDLLREVGLDVRPGNDQNTVNPQGRGKVPVAILSDAAFDALADLDTSTLTFGATGGEESLASCSDEGEDVDGDGLLDRVCKFRADATGLEPGDTGAVLRGRTPGGYLLEGRGSVHVPG